MIRIIAVGTKMPNWVSEGYQEYVKRLPTDYRAELIEIPLEKRNTTTSIPQLLQAEGLKITKILKPEHTSVALTITGKSWHTLDVAHFLKQQHDQSLKIDFIIGGPDGLPKEIVSKVNHEWSLSPLTFPHPLVRIILAEQLYRAWSVISKHPYHRN